MKSFLTACIFLCLSIPVTAQVGVGTATPDASAQLEIAAPDKGVLIPRMTAAVRVGIALPATGLLVYQTDGSAGFYYNSGSAGTPSWVLLQTAINVTTQGNTFNTAGQLVQLNGTAQLPAVSGANVTGINADNISTGTVASARLGTGTASGTTFLKGDGTWGAATAAYPSVLNAGTAFTSTTINSTYTDIQTIVIPSTGKYLITAVGYTGTNTSEGLLIQVTQGGTPIAEAASYTDAVAVCNLSHVVNLTTTTSIKIRARMASWATVSSTSFTGTYSVIKLAD